MNKNQIIWGNTQTTEIYKSDGFSWPLLLCLSAVPTTPAIVSSLPVSTNGSVSFKPIFRMLREFSDTSTDAPVSTTVVTTTSEPKNPLEDRTSATCVAWSRDHVTTFDGAQMTVEQTCPYLLAAVIDRSWGVSVRNVECDLISTCRKQIEFTLGLDEVAVVGSGVTVNGRSVNSLPYVNSGKSDIVSGLISPALPCSTSMQVRL